ncbi:hypothetical protein PTKIN_Ptkin10aG0119000 [Pterospermum kingtungense]
MQFQPVVQPQQPQQFVPVASQQFQPVGRGVIVMNAGFPPQTQQPQFPQVMQQLPARLGQPGHILPAAPAISLPKAQPNRHISSRTSLRQPNIQTPNNYVPGVPASHLSSSYPVNDQDHIVVPVSHHAMAQYPPMPLSQALIVPLAGQVGIHFSQSSSSVIPMLQIGEQASVPAAIIPGAIIQPKPTGEASTDWIEHTSANGRRYYYNKKTRQSSWEKPSELMTSIERADASTNWKEFMSPNGRKYYHNKVTNQSTWSIPEKLKLAREQVEKASAQGPQSEVFSHSPAPALTVIRAPYGGDTSATIIQGASSSPVPAVPVPATSNVQSVVASGSALTVGTSSLVTNLDEVQTAADVITPSAAVSESSEVSITVVDTVTTSINNISKVSSLDMISAAEGVSPQNANETVKDVVVSEKLSSALEEKAIDQEPLTYAIKQEAKNAFKALLESSNVGSDWTWDQAMRVIINDKRYGALRTLGERKQAFNEECSELTSSTRWSKGVTMFEDDVRYKAVEQEKDRKDLFENYIDELRQKERAKAQEQRKRNIIEYRQFLESCNFIKANSQWRKVQGRLETDERCLCLGKIDRLEIFQEYIRDLEKEEEDQRKIQKSAKIVIEFRKLMEEHVASGILTAETYWRDYCMMVKDSPRFLAVASNTSGSTPKDLFEDVAEELQKQYHDDKVRVKDAVKLRKISLASTWTLEDLRAAIVEDVSSTPISDVNLKLVFEELLERARDKEEKEAEKRKRHSDDFFDLLHSIKEIASSSTWEDCKHLFESSQEFSSIGDEAFCKGILEEYMTELKEEAEEKERRRKEDKHASAPESDSENRHKRHKRNYRNGSRRNVDPKELEDGEFGERESREGSNGFSIQCFRCFSFFCLPTILNFLFNRGVRVKEAVTIKLKLSILVPSSFDSCFYKGKFTNRTIYLYTPNGQGHLTAAVSLLKILWKFLEFFGLSSSSSSILPAELECLKFFLHR